MGFDDGECDECDEVAHPGDDQCPGCGLCIDHCQDGIEEEVD